MKILIVDAFRQTEDGRRLYRDFKGAVISTFSEWKGFRPHLEFREKGELEEFLYDPTNGYRELEALNQFDKLDFVIIGGGQTVAPWSSHPAAKALLTLVRMCSHTGKCVFGSSFIAAFLGYVLATGGGPATVLNKSRVSISEVTKQVSSPGFIMKPTDAYLDYNTGDLYQLNPTKKQWEPVINTGLKSRLTTQKTSTSDALHKMKEHNKHIGRCTTAKNYEYRCHVPAITRGHWMTKGLQTLNFVAPMRSTWILDSCSNKRCSNKYKVIILSESNVPAVVQYENIVCTQFELERKYPITITIFQNFVRRKMREILEHGDIDRSSKVLLNTIPQSKTSLMAPAPVLSTMTQRLTKGPVKPFAMLESHSGQRKSRGCQHGEDAESVFGDEELVIADQALPLAKSESISRNQAPASRSKANRPPAPQVIVKFRPRSIHDQAFSVALSATTYLARAKGSSGAQVVASDHRPLQVNHVGATLATVLRQPQEGRKLRNRPASAKTRTSERMLQSNQAKRPMSARQGQAEPRSKTVNRNSAPKHPHVPQRVYKSSQVDTKKRSKVTARVVKPPLAPQCRIAVPFKGQVPEVHFSPRKREHEVEDSLQGKRPGITPSKTQEGENPKVKDAARNHLSHVDSRLMKVTELLDREQRKNSTDSVKSSIQSRGIRVRSKRGQKAILRQESPRKHMGRPKARMKQFNNWRKYQRVRKQVLDTHGPIERFSLAANGPYESPTERDLREHREGKEKWVGGGNSPFKLAVGKATTTLSKVAGITWDGPYLPPSQHDFRGLKRVDVPWIS